MDYQRIIILLGLAVTSYLLILAWNEDYKQGALKESVSEQVSQSDPGSSAGIDEIDLNLVSDEPGPDIVPTIDPAETSEMVSVPVIQSVSDPNNIITVSTDVFEIQISKLGGDIVQGALPKFPASLESLDIPFLLVDPANTYTAQSGLIGKNGTDTSSGRPVFVSQKSHYEMGESDELILDLTLPEENGVRITKRYIFKRSDYLITLEYIINNQSSEIWQASLFAQIKRDSGDPVMSDTSGMGMQPFTGGATFNSDSPYTKLAFDDIEEESYKAKVEGGYMAMVQHYFVTAWVPMDQQTYTYQARKLRNQDVYLYGFTGPAWQVKAGQLDSLTAGFYMGPKDQYRLEEISPGLNLTVDYGFLWWLAQPLFDLLTFIHTYVNNWGLSIILLTIIVKSLLYPLSAASFKSMAKMRKLQPEMARLKDRYGDDKQQFSQAMMDLYKKEGANPLGGCLPMLLQMPVFLALYWSLMESVELRQAPFILWIHDLSAMDPYFVLPILMGLSMFATQMMQPEPPDPVQAKVFKMMPIMFTFFFLWFPAGLVLYWLINNLLSILQQWYVTRQLDKKT